MLTRLIAGYPLQSELIILHEIVSQTQRDEMLPSDVNEKAIHSLLESDLGVQTPLHISLSRPFVLQTEDRGGFLETLKSALRGAHVQP